MMGYDADDELKYLGGAPPTSLKEQSSRNSFFQEAEDEEDAISRSERTRRGSLQHGRKEPKAKRSLVFEEDDVEKDLDASDFYNPRGSSSSSSSSSSRRLNDDEITKNPIMEKMEFLIPIDRAASGSEIVPSKAQSAAETLLFYTSANGGHEITLPETVIGPLRLLVNRVDEFTQVDPLVMLSATLSLPESCAIYLEETLPVSIYLLARVLNISFDVAITPKRRVRGVSLDSEELVVSVKPYKGQDRKRGESFHLRELVEQSDRMDDNKWVQIEAYMITLGQLPPKRVCDLTFIDEQMENFKKILGGQLKVVRPYKKKK